MKETKGGKKRVEKEKRAMTTTERYSHISYFIFIFFILLSICVPSHRFIAINLIYYYFKIK